MLMMNHLTIFPTTSLNIYLSYYCIINPKSYSNMKSIIQLKNKKFSVVFLIAEYFLSTEIDEFMQINIFGMFTLILKKVYHGNFFVDRFTINV